jgi:hypothetical protein
MNGPNSVVLGAALSLAQRRVFFCLQIFPVIKHFITAMNVKGGSPVYSPVPLSINFNSIHLKCVLHLTMLTDVIGMVDSTFSANLVQFPSLADFISNFKEIGCWQNRGIWITGCSGHFCFRYLNENFTKY